MICTLRTVRPPHVAATVDPGVEEAASEGASASIEGEHVEVDVDEGEAAEEAAADEEVPPVPAPHPVAKPRARPSKRMTVDEHASVENKGVLVSKAQLPVPLTDVKVPSPDEVARHNLTHLPYKRLCKSSVGARCPNLPHVRLPPFSRKHPLFVLDYCFVRKSTDQDLITVVVGRLYPSRTVFAVPCDVKGPDEHAINRLVTFFTHCGIYDFNYMCDQESSIETLIQAAIKVAGREAEWVGAVPEHSAVGESQSNARAERAVQEVEDLLRTMLAALEHRIKARIPSCHPVVRWLVEHVATTINKYAVHESTDQTSFEALHGRRATEKIAESGERILFEFLPSEGPSWTCDGAVESTWERQ